MLHYKPIQVAVVKRRMLPQLRQGMDVWTISAGVRLAVSYGTNGELVPGAERPVRSSIPYTTVPLSRDPFRQVAIVFPTEGIYDSIEPIRKWCERYARPG
jgi:hypothetical protein